MKKILTIFIFYFFTIVSLNANSSEIKKDILSIVTDNYTSSLNDEKLGLYLETEHCSSNSKYLLELEKELLKKGLKNPKTLISKFNKMICTNKGSNISIDKSSNDYKKVLLTGQGIYRGSKALGDWACKAKTVDKKANTISMYGIFINKTQVSLWQVKSKEKISIWLAPFKFAPSDTIKFDMQFINNSWKVIGFCNSTRL